MLVRSVWHSCHLGGGYSRILPVLRRLSLREEVNTLVEVVFAFLANLLNFPLPLLVHQTALLADLIAYLVNQVAQMVYILNGIADVILKLVQVGLETLNAAQVECWVIFFKGSGFIFCPGAGGESWSRQECELVQLAVGFLRIAL